MPEHLRPTYRVVDEDGAGAGARQGPRGAQGATAAEVRRRRWPRSRPTAAWPAPARPPGSSAPSSPSFTRRRAGHEVQGYPTLVDEGATVGLPGRRVQPMSRRPGTGWGCDGCCCSSSRSPAPAVLRRPDQRGEARPGRVAVPLASPSWSRTAARPSSRRWSMRVRRCARRRRTTRCATRPARDHETQLRATLGDVLRVLDGLAADREGPQRTRGHGDAAGPHRHARPARPAGPPRASSARRRRDSSCAATRRTSPHWSIRREKLAEQAQHGPAADGPDRRRSRRPTCTRSTRCPRAGRPGARLRQVRWMLEEYRVSLWAQQLGTPSPVSDQRIRRSLQA